MWWYDPISLVFIISSACGAMSIFLSQFCSSCRMSRCLTIRLCCGAFECTRENLSETEFAEELENQQKQVRQAGALQESSSAI